MGTIDLNEQNFSPKNEESANKKPPRDPLVLRIGVTGHRTELHATPAGVNRKRPIPDIPAIRTSVHEILEVIRASFKSVADSNRELFDLAQGEYRQPGRETLRIISALASGADQWVVEEALKFGFELQAILPFSREEYLKDFKVKSEANTYKKLLSEATAILELDGKIGTDEKGKRKPDSWSYESVGRGILKQTDILIAIWDGEDAKGRGGTGQVVREALQNSIPVIWIPWNNTEKWKLLENSLFMQDDLHRDNNHISIVIQNIVNFNLRSQDYVNKNIL